MHVTKQEVEHVAKLARLELTEAEKDALGRQLSSILTYMEKLNTFDTEGVEPTATVFGAVNVFREDEVRRSLPVDQVLANAPDREEGYFRVPKILEDRSRSS